VGNVAGKDAVGVYYQAPYTDYDRENLIETASVNLGNYAKTDLLQPGESQSMEITFAVDEMKSYDYKNSQTYVLEAGDYYVTAAPNAHQAINNILSAKGYGVENGMTSEGESGFVDVYSVNATSSLNTAKSGAEITNIFDFATVSDYAYLTRQNWLMMEERGLTYATGTMNSVSSYTNSTGTVGTVVADAETLTLLQSSGWETSGRPSDQDITETNIVVEAQNGLELVDLRGADYDDPRWDDLLDEMTFQELYDIYTNGSSGTNAAQSINKPATAEVDGPSGISNYISGEGVGGFCSEVLLGSTWNQELAYLQGTYLGNNSVLNGGSNGWYAPAVNIHRTPFGGRNDEYFSEDPMLSGMMASQEIKGIQHYGVYTFIKHFALNEQETNRGTNGCYAAYATEQAIREIYLKPFEIAFTYGSSEERENSLGVMVSMNRIGAINTRGCYALLTSLLRNEWGFQGSIITDACNDSGAQANQDIAAGVNYIMNPGGASFSSGTIKENRLRNALRDSAHHYLYVIVNSNAMNGMYNGAVYTEGTPVYWLILIATDVAIVGIIVLSDVVIFRKLRKKDVEEVR
jgi:beta-glucosidase